MNYPVVLHKDRDSDYGVTVPDLPGCFSAGKTVDEALAMAKEAIELHIEELIDEGLPVPRSGGSISTRRMPNTVAARGRSWRSTPSSTILTRSLRERGAMRSSWPFWTSAPTD